MTPALIQAAKKNANPMPGPSHVHGCDTGINALDVQYGGETVHVLFWPHNVTMNMHVTGCTYASTTAANLVEGTVIFLPLRLPICMPGELTFFDTWDAGDSAQDVLYDGETAHVLSGPRIETMNTHGTGCTTASAIAAELAKGASVLSAAHAAKTYVSEALQRSARLQIGTGSQRPFNHGCAVSQLCCQNQWHCLKIFNSWVCCFLTLPAKLEAS